MGDGTGPEDDMSAGWAWVLVGAAYRCARQEAREELEYTEITKGFTIKQFNKVGE